MDDILLLANKNSNIDTDSLIKDFESSTCYMPPLKLEAADQGTFLETFIYNKGDKMEWRLKNKNEPHELQKFYNYQHFHSYSPKHTKIGAVIGVFKKINRLCSNPTQKAIALQHKIKEFTELKYPLREIHYLANSIINWRWEPRTWACGASLEMESLALLS